MHAPAVDRMKRWAHGPLAVMLAAAALLSGPALAQDGPPKEQAERVQERAAQSAPKAADTAPAGNSAQGAKAAAAMEDDSAEAPIATPTEGGPDRTIAPQPRGAEAGVAAAQSGVSNLTKFGVLAIIVLLLAAIGFLVWSNAQLKKELRQMQRFQADRPEGAGRQSLVSGQETARPQQRQRAPYGADTQTDGVTTYTRRGEGQNAAEPHMVGDDNWDAALPPARDQDGQTHMGEADPYGDTPMPRLTPHTNVQGGSIADRRDFAGQAPPPPAPSPAPTGPMLRLPMDAVQDLVRRAPEMAASEFRAAANALGQWYEVNINGTGGTLHLGEDDGLPRPLIAILQGDGSAVVVPSAQYARDFAFQHYKIRNSESLRAFFDLQLASRTELSYAAPCLVAIEGQVVRVVQRGVLSGFSD